MCHHTLHIFEYLFQCFFSTFIESCVCSFQATRHRHIATNQVGMSHNLRPTTKEHATTKEENRKTFKFPRLTLTR